ncbi:MAG: flotillin family protein [Bacteroidales bacterium]|nr:flotillin family protein [Bacteroidales bacterium]MBN2756245.1 flotillin family protein [Bacteroidales bacterium]
MGQLVVVVIALAILFVFVLIYSLFKRFKRCPADHILVIYGKVGGSGNSAKCIHGGAAFIWPIIQDYEYLDLTPIPIEVDLRNALSRQNIRVNVPSRFMVGISTIPEVMANAAERLLGLAQDEIRHLAADIIFGQLRVVIATMDIEDINSDREKFLKNITEGVEHELIKIGLKLINVNVTDITDESGYIDALGREAASGAINEAKIAVALKERNGSIGEAEANREKRIQVSAADANAVIGEAQAQQNERINVAAANAAAVEGENNAKITVANSDANRRKQEAEAEKIALTAEKTNEANALEAAYKAEQIAELGRAEKVKATQYADTIVPAEIEKQRIEISAEANAEKIRRLAKGDADGIYLKMEAEAKGLFEILTKQAEGFKKIVQAAGDDSNDAVKLMIADKLPELVRMQVEAIKNIKIDKITVWDSGNKDGVSSTANFMKSMAGAIPPLDDLFKQAGMQLPDYLKGKNENSENIEETEG